MLRSVPSRMTPAGLMGARSPPRRCRFAPGLALGIFSGVLSHFSDSRWVDVSLELSVTFLIFVPLSTSWSTCSTAQSQLHEVRLARSGQDAKILRESVADLKQSADLRLEEVHAIIERRLHHEACLDGGRHGVQRLLGPHAHPGDWWSD